MSNDEPIRGLEFETRLGRFTLSHDWQKSLWFASFVFLFVLSLPSQWKYRSHTRVCCNWGLKTELYFIVHNSRIIKLFFTVYIWTMYLSRLQLFYCFVFFFASLTMYIYFILMYSVYRTEKNKCICIVLYCLYCILYKTSHAKLLDNQVHT